MKHATIKARILLAFDEGKTLTRKQALDIAGAADVHEFRHHVDAGLLEATEWKPSWPREYRVTPAGLDRQKQYRHE